MKIVIRAFVVVLALTGAAASTQIANASSSTIKVTAAKTSAMPIPMCDPSDEHACGIVPGK